MKAEENYVYSYILYTLPVCAKLCAPEENFT